MVLKLTRHWLGLSHRNQWQQRGWSGSEHTGLKWPAFTAVENNSKYLKVSMSRLSNKATAAHTAGFPTGFIDIMSLTAQLSTTIYRYFKTAYVVATSNVFFCIMYSILTDFSPLISPKPPSFCTEDAIFGSDVMESPSSLGSRRSWNIVFVYHFFI